jgi:hypothetical protein
MNGVAMRIERGMVIDHKKSLECYVGTCKIQSLYQNVR